MDAHSRQLKTSRSSPRSHWTASCLKRVGDHPIITVDMANMMPVHIDAPWCSVTTTSAAHALLPSQTDPSSGIPKSKKWAQDVESGVKGRNEPGDVSLAQPPCMSKRLLTLTYETDHDDRLHCSSSQGRAGRASHRSRLEK